MPKFVERTGVAEMAVWKDSEYYGPFKPSWRNASKRPGIDSKFYRFTLFFYLRNSIEIHLVKSRILFCI